MCKTYSACTILLLAACIGCSEEPKPIPAEQQQTEDTGVQDPTEKMNLEKRNVLIAKIIPQYEADGNPEVMPVVSVDDFFEGNTDDYSIAPNTVDAGHPGVAEFRRVLTEIRGKPNVQDVLVAIHETPEPDDPEDFDIWPDSDTVYVITSASPEQLAQWASNLKFSEVSEGWSAGVKPSSAPQPQPSMKVLKLWWD